MIKKKLKISNHIVGYSWLLKSEPIYINTNDNVNLLPLESVLFQENPKILSTKNYLFLIYSN